MKDAVPGGESDMLNRMGIQYATDKVAHGFCPFYDKHLRAGRERVKKVLEIGVLGGSSLYMWRDYFPNAIIHGIDVARTGIESADRIATHVADQQDRAQLQALVDEIGTDFDLIVDDGGHTMGQQQVSLACLFPHVRAGGFYVVEDLHTSFTPHIEIYRNGVVVDRYDTGVGKCACTTFDVVDRLSRDEQIDSDFMSDAERRYLHASVDSVEIFDRDGDHRHMTCIIRKRPYSLMQKIGIRILHKLLD